jgi:hypothetical protein
MSALAQTAVHRFDPPIAASSVPRCPCQRAQPCVCESFARRLELRHRNDQERMIGAAETLRALAVVETAETTKRALLNLAEWLF